MTMAEKSMPKKIKEKLMASDDYAASLAVHMKAFGPILALAFAHDEVAKVKLVAALNHISRREIQRGEALLEELKIACKTNQDIGAWHFFSGVAKEMLGDVQGVKQCYTDACLYQPNFYLPYLKLAKIYHNEGDFAMALSAYQSTLITLPQEASDADQQTQKIISSVCCNMASVLTMMHEYDKAAEALALSVEIEPVNPMRQATYAILYAARGDATGAQTCIDAMKNHYHPTVKDMAQPTEAQVTQILQGKHPQFAPQSLSPQAVADFWGWIAEAYGDFCQEGYDRVKMRIEAALGCVFPFMHRPMVQSFSYSETGCLSLTLCDRYAVALTEGYEILKNAIPAHLPVSVTMTIVH